MGKLGAPDTENALKQQSNDTHDAQWVIEQNNSLILYDFTGCTLVFAQE